MEKIIRNPYFNRKMIKDTDDFYGRKREVNLIYSMIDAPRPQCVSIVGNRRIGKSSLLYFIYDENNRKKYIQNPDDFIFVFMDLQTNQDITEEEFLYALFAQLKLEAGIDVDEGSPYDALIKFASELERNRQKLVVLLDEFESITGNPNFGHKFFSFLRSVANRYDVAYITSSAKELQKLCHTQEVAVSPFFNIFSSLYLRPFTMREARELITKPSAAAGIPLADYMDPIFQLAGTFPFFLQIACSAFFDGFLIEGELDDEGIAEIEWRFLDEARPHFEYVWEQFSPVEKSVCLKLSKEEQIEPREQYALKALERNGYVKRVREGYLLFSKVFNECLSNLDLNDRMKHQEESAKLESERAEKERLEQELLDAHQMQMSLLPEKDPEIEGYQITGICKPTMEVGGDFFDYIKLKDGKLGIAIADVSGKSLKAAMAAVMANGMLHSESKACSSPNEILSILNESLHQRLERRTFVALSLACIDTEEKQVSLSNAGIPYPIIKRGNGIIEMETGGMPLGMIAGIEHKPDSIQLQPGDFLIFHTDGIIEAENETEEMYSYERMYSTIQRADYKISARELINFILFDVQTFAGEARQYDDITLVVLKVMSTNTS